MKVSDVITVLRRQISDEISPYRITDPMMVDYYNLAKNTLYGTNPEAYYVDGIITLMPDDVTTINDQTPLCPLYKMEVINLMASYVFQEDAEDANNMAVANDHLNKYTAGKRGLK